MKALTIIAAGLLSVSTVFAQNGEKARDIRKDKQEIRKDRQDIRKDKAERNAAIQTGHPAVAAKKQHDVNVDKKDIRSDKRELRRDATK